MTIEALRREMQSQFPYWGWDGPPREEDTSTYLQRAWEHAEAGNTGSMESMIAMALRTSNANYLNEGEITTMRIHGYGVFINNTTETLLELEGTYDERCNDEANFAVMSLIDAKEKVNTTATPEERAEVMVSTSQKFLLNHIALLDFECPQVEKAQHKLDELFGNATSADAT